MSILNVEHLSHGFGDRAIFHDGEEILIKEFGYEDFKGRLG